MLRAVLLFLAFSAVSAYQCNGTTTIETPSDLSQPTFYPLGWNENQPVPQIDPDQACALYVNITQGVYATVTFYRQFGRTGGMYVLYSNNKIELLEDNDPNPFIFVAPNFKLNFGSYKELGYNSNGFAFKIVWAQYPAIKQNVVNIYKGAAPVAVSANNALTSFIGATNSLISLVAFSLADPSTNALLRQSAVYAGDSVNGEFVGTLGQVVSSQTKLTTYKNKMSVYTFGLSQTIDSPLFMAQDWNDGKGPWIYKGANCPSAGRCNVTLNGNADKAMTVTDFDGVETIQDFNAFPPQTVINVYENNYSNTTCIATLTSVAFRQQLPIRVKGTLKYYEMIGMGHCEMVVTRETSRASRL
ncbi:unnamed protein product [Caenorhabditis sp. 36 PRJEB53466]|nr:unnamed protein product [Caenorhabditis sp. 36 PRJEB53466]